MKTAPPRENIIAAKSAGLRYVNDDDPGITRVRAGKGFRYVGPDKHAVTDTATLARIKRLAIPPAWTDVWICPRDDGHIQAAGRDARGRKQYRYHSDWRAVRDETKYERMIAFGRALPRIRRRIARDLKRRGLGREKVLATMVRLLETTLVRVGNEEYARENGSIGLSTMRDKHVDVRGGTLDFQFRGKGGKRHHIALHDPRLAGIVRRVQDLPGQKLFQYVDENGEQQEIKSEDVNDYLREVAGDEFSAKDFRTWAGTVLAAIALRQFEKFETKAQAKKNIVAAIERVAQRLGNTPAVCRKCYIHPEILNSYLDGRTVEILLKKTEETLSYGLPELSGAEGAVLAYLQQRLRRKKSPPLLTQLRRSLANGSPAPARRESRRDFTSGSAARAYRPRGARGGDTSGGVHAAARSRRRRSSPSAPRPRRGR
jgi:DNA topoisomerase-1